MPLLRPALLACALCAAVAAPSFAEGQTRGVQQILADAPLSAWRDLDPERTLYMDLDAGRVVIELAPAFAPAHARNIATLARGHFWDGTSIYRVQDNFVAQFGDAEGEEPEKARDLGQAERKLPAEFERAAAGLVFDRLPDADGWAAEVGFADGFPAGRDPREGKAWLAHCYGMVGAGRNAEPDSSIGAELYAVIGQSPRQLDRNITLVGRVVKGIELLSSLPRGPEPMGFYEDPAQRTPIRSVRLASELPADERLHIQALRTDSAAFAELVEARRNRRDDFYKRPAGHIDLCNVMLPVRVVAN
ncbi:putative secreted peptidyl prolyl cis-trans isomerase, cyclophilin type [Pseudoxanthomonas suwonensis 11-1]|uniref:peptidylprolyl isomerase n=1 Tax=Pseudoxanthomonas suwonensis (strain 11-1) TaxID=743721 RepID=E6WUN4_PSEUU|nr:peptidylprolyl isomerase [Pseudoxanthomonas suwonensis]ADV27736.1 putative secreted peptidyl prolyl cis-trans isomerase, cyclophilin type [Pseudoxanthomonas suwonensis 11-1]